MPKKLPPKNSSWVQLTKDFVKEWPEILEGLHFKNMPVKYLLYCNINLKNQVEEKIRSLKQDLEMAKMEETAKFLKELVSENYSQFKYNIFLAYNLLIF